MASETITRNDLTAILNEVLPPTPSEYKKLLWTNPNASTLGATTINLPLSDYDVIEIWVSPMATHVPIPFYLDTSALPYAGSISSARNELLGIRSVSATATSITFGEGKYFTAYGNYSSPSTGANIAVPKKIYGIKYDRVAPTQVGYMPEFENPVDVVSSMINSPYWTCPADGIIVASAISSGSATGIYIQDNTLNIRACGMYQNTMANNTTLSCTAPVLKGHIYQRNYHSGQGSGQVYYYKFK